MTLLTGLIGVIMLSEAVRRWGLVFTPLAAIGAVHLMVAVFSSVQQVRAALSPPGLRKLRSAELAVMLLWLPYCLLVLWLGVVGPTREPRLVTGQPIEVRAQSRSVFMPGGERFTYTCWKDEGRGSGTCPAEARWDALPRWPAVQQVHMEVVGHEIRSLTMDGVVIVDPAEFRFGDWFERVLTLIAGPLLTAFAVFVIARRIRLLTSPAN